MEVLYVKIEILESQNESFKSENTTLKSENSMLKMLLKENIAFTNRIVEILAKMDVLLENTRHHHPMSHSNESPDLQNVISDVKMDVQNLEETSNGVQPFENQNPDFGTDATAPRHNASHLDVETHPTLGGEETDKMDFSDQQTSETNHVTSMSHQIETSHDLGGIDLNGLEDFDIDLPGLTCGTGIASMKNEYQYSQVEPMTPPSEPQNETNLAPPSGEITQQTVVHVEQWQNIPLENTEIAQFKEEYQQYGQQPMTPPCESLAPPCDQTRDQMVQISENKPNTKPESAKKATKGPRTGPSRKKQKIEHDNPYFAQNDAGYFICPYDSCSTTMKHRHALVEHIRIHTGEKPFKCAICSKRFRCAGTIRKHLKTVHKSDMGSQRFQEVTRLSLQMTSSASDDL